MLVPISQIHVPTPNRYDLGNIKSLADNIAEFGLLHPILINEKYELVAGYRRLKAAELLGWTEVPVSVISPQDELKQFDTSLHENFRRKDLNPLEICDIILERKYRWEKIHGQFKTGPKSGENTTQVEFLTNCQKFNLETAIILRMCERDIYRFLQLKELDDDIRQQVWERKLSYTKAITMQSSRKKEQKLAKSKKVSIPNLPDRETAIALQAEYNRSPVFFQIMMLVGHMYQSINRFQGKQPEFDAANPDRLVMLIGQIAPILSWLNNLNKEAQNILMKQAGTQISAEK